MKNIVKTLRTLGLAGLIALSSGCKEPKEFVLEEPSLRDMGGSAYVDGYVDRKYTNIVVAPLYNLTFDSFSTWRNYPSAGRTKPYAEVKEDFLGISHVKLCKPYQPFRFNSGL